MICRALLHQGLIASALSLAATAASVHTGAGGVSGGAAGFAHPFHGLDHLLAMLAVGLWAGQLGGRAVWAVPSAFVLCMMAGGALGMTGLSLPLVEAAIALSVLALGAAVLLATRLPLMAGMLAAGAFALFHGHAHGAEMPAQAAAVAYAMGFAAATALLHGVGIAVSMLTKAPRLGRAIRASGGAIAIIGFMMLVGL